jgi:hypothetical protein
MMLKIFLIKISNLIKKLQTFKFYSILASTQHSMPRSACMLVFRVHILVSLIRVSTRQYLWRCIRILEPPTAANSIAFGPSRGASQPRSFLQAFIWHAFCKAVAGAASGTKVLASRAYDLNGARLSGTLAV